MSRLKQCRKISTPPSMIGFKPFGISQRNQENLALQMDEYEAIRLLDYEGLTQEKAAEQMAVSRPTLTRIYEKARNTIAKALVEGKSILITGGNVEFDRKWYRCKRCHKVIGGIENHIPCKNCPSFGNEELQSINE